MSRHKGKAAEPTYVIDSAATSGHSGYEESQLSAANPLVPEEWRRRRELTVATRI
jgi:hypothetical protein